MKKASKKVAVKAKAKIKKVDVKGVEIPRAELAKVFQTLMDINAAVVDLLEDIELRLERS